MSRLFFRCIGRNQSHSIQYAISYANKRVFSSTRIYASPKSRVIFSGIQPTGIPHLGNYLGALHNWVNLQRDTDSNLQIIFSIVGWHALTLPQNAQDLLAARLDMLAVLLAIGLDPKRCIMFFQEDNPDHLELAWIFNCLTSVGRLRRMTTWKSRLAVARNVNDESEIDESLLNAGLLTYPVLQAADILAYKATEVPVGDDQIQHLELCRDTAELFNRTFKSPLFPLPQPFITPSKRILSLKDPTSKMSKSALDPQSRILLTDSFDQIRSKVRAAVTDSTPGITFDPMTRPGTSNLLSILAGCTSRAVDDITKEYTNASHGRLKADVIDAVEEILREPREEFGKLKEDRAYLNSVARQGADSARSLSKETMVSVRRLVGLQA